jgi:hypothetical protein
MESFNLRLWDVASEVEILAAAVQNKSHCLKKIEKNVTILLDEKKEADKSFTSTVSSTWHPNLWALSICSRY